MATQGNGGRSGRIRLAHGGFVIDILLPQGTAALVPRGFNVETWLTFSDLERRILLQLLTSGPAKKATLAHALDVSPDGALKHILANLCERRILANRPAGYTILAAADKLPEIKAGLEKEPG